MKRSNVLRVSQHAVERFRQRWRPTWSLEEARACLEGLAARAAATRRNTLPGNAVVYVTQMDEGERVPLAVRDGVVVTVLEVWHDKRGAVFGGVDPEDPLYLESEATRRECQAMLKADAERASDRDARGLARQMAPP